MFIIVSGLPASGKSTLARALTARLELPLLDKDDVLESLFDTLGVGDLDWRRCLSRKSDLMFQGSAMALPGAVLTSFWRHPALDTSAGTPTEWLSNLSGNLVEVHCACSALVAVARFQGRSRHPGHNDNARTSAQLLQQFEVLGACGPLGIGRLVRVETSGAFDLDATVAAVKAAVKTGAS